MEYNQIKEEVFKNDNIAIVKRAFTEGYNGEFGILLCFDNLLSLSVKHQAYKVLNYLLAEHYTKFNNHEFHSAIYELINKKDGIKYIKQIIENKNYPNHNTDYSFFILKAVKYQRLTILKYFLSLDKIIIEKKKYNIVIEAFYKHSKNCLRSILSKSDFQEEELIYVGFTTAAIRKDFEFLDIFYEFYPQFKIDFHKISEYCGKAFDFQELFFEESVEYFQQLQLKNKISEF